MKNAKQIKSYTFYPFSFRLRTEGQSGLTNRQKMLRNQSNQCESVPHSRPSLRTNKPNVTQTCLRRCSNVAALLQHHSWTGWVDVTVWASIADFSSSSSSCSSSSGPQQLLQGQWFRKDGWCRGVAVKHYVVLIRLSSCLMAVGKREKT